MTKEELQELSNALTWVVNAKTEKMVRKLIAAYRAKCEEVETLLAVAGESEKTVQTQTATL